MGVWSYLKLKTAALEFLRLGCCFYFANWKQLLALERKLHALGGRCHLFIIHCTHFRSQWKIFETLQGKRKIRGLHSRQSVWENLGCRGKCLWFRGKSATQGKRPKTTKERRQHRKVRRGTRARERGYPCDRRGAVVDLEEERRSEDKYWLGKCGDGILRSRLFQWLRYKWDKSLKAEMFRIIFVNNVRESQFSDWKKKMLTGRRAGARMDITSLEENDQLGYAF